MTAQNLNNASSGNWLATIPGFEEVTFKLRTCPIPGFSSSPLSLPTSAQYLLPDTGDRINYEELMMEFYIDDNFRNYRKIHDWVKRSVANGVADRRDITVQLLDNQRNPQGVAVVFFGAYAYGMTQVDTDVNNEIPDLTCAIMLKYINFEFIDDECETC